MVPISFLSYFWVFLLSKETSCIKVAKARYMPIITASGKLRQGDPELIMRSAWAIKQEPVSRKRKRKQVADERVILRQQPLFQPSRRVS